jgi:transposase
VIGLRERGLTYEAIAAQTGLSPTGVFNIRRRFAEHGLAGPRGPEPGTGRLLDAPQEAEICALICRRTPDELGLPFALWSRAAVRALIEHCYGVRVAVRTMGTYLARWGLAAQQPLRCADEQRPEEVQRWLERDYPALAARGKRVSGRNGVHGHSTDGPSLA